MVQSRLSRHVPVRTFHSDATTKGGALLRGDANVVSDEEGKIPLANGVVVHHEVRGAHDRSHDDDGDVEAKAPLAVQNEPRPLEWVHHRLALVAGVPISREEWAIPVDWKRQLLPNMVHPRTHVVVEVAADGEEDTRSTVPVLVAVAHLVGRESSAC